MKNLFTLSALCAAALIATAAVAAPLPSAADRATIGSTQGTVLARETEAGDVRGGKGRDDASGHRAIEQLPTTIAREGEVRGEGAGHPVSEQMPVTIAREGEVRGEGAGHPVSEQMPVTIAREGEVRGEGAGHPVSEQLPATIA